MSVKMRHWTRTLSSLFLLVISSLILTSAGRIQTSQRVAFLIIFVALDLVAIRGMMVGVVLKDNYLIIRNFLGAIRVDRDSILDFSLERIGGRQVLAIQTKDRNSIPLEAIGGNMYIAASQTWLLDQLTVLRRWKSETL